jgi:ribose transport system substrate-binding protein
VIAMIAGCGAPGALPGTTFGTTPTLGTGNGTGTGPTAAATLKAIDNQPLFAVDESTPQIPKRPDDPKSLPETNALHWYDTEYAGWNVKKVDMPKSPGSGPRGKTVVCLRFSDSYLNAYSKGMQKAADFYGIKLKNMVAKSDARMQAQQVDQVISEKPDLVIIIPADPTEAVSSLKKLNAAGIPVIASNQPLTDEGMKYVLAWTGADDWGQFRLLADKFADLMHDDGGYCIIRHAPTSAGFTSRTYAPITELAKVAPKMKLLDMQTTDLNADKTTQVVAAWITKFGPSFRGIISPNDSTVQTAINNAIKDANRQDIIRVAAGNSRTGMKLVKNGQLQAITYQSAESDGAVPIKLAATWFSGKPIDKPVYYLKKMIITKENAKQYLPAQW